MSNLEERSDALDEQMAKHPAEESIAVLVKDARRSKRRLQLLTISVILDFLLTIGFAYITYRTHQVAQLAQSNKAAVIQNCEVSNEARNKQLTLWGYVLAITPEQPRTQAQEQQTQEFQKFVQSTFAPRDCQAEVNK